MVDAVKQSGRKGAQGPRIVGAFIRSKREALGLSQRALGQLFDPTVTTQFISNVERGVTPLPPTHVPTLAKSLKVTEAELMDLLQQEYALKLSGRLGVEDPAGSGMDPISVELEHADFFKKVYQAYRNGDGQTRKAFHSVCSSILKVETEDSTEKAEDDTGPKTPF